MIKQRIKGRTGRGFQMWLAALLTLLMGGSAWAAVGGLTHHDAGLLKTAVVTDKTLLWRVERSGLRPSYVFGTIHSEDPRVAELPPAVIQAFRLSDAFAMEMIPDQAALAGMSAAMFISEGPNLRDMLGDEWFQRTAALVSLYGVPPAILSSLKPWVVFTALTMPKAEEGMFLDVILYGAALHDGKYIHGLETADEQVNTFESIDLDDQVAILKDVVVNHEAIGHLNQELVNSYTRGDLGAIASLQSQYISSGDQRLEQMYQQRTIDDRNLRMVDRMVPRIEEENIFIAIDAWHLPGVNGVLHLLEQRGYRVSPVQ